MYSLQTKKHAVRAILVDIVIIVTHPPRNVKKNRTPES